MKILIADDEALARERLRGLLNDLDPAPDIVAEAGDGLTALRATANLSPDIVLLDVRMPGMDGLECARELAHLPASPCVIFTTAYDEYALDAFDVAACDYLLKPIRRDRLQAALVKARSFQMARWHALSEQLPVATQSRIRICAHSQGELRLVGIEEVIYFYAEQKYTVVRTSKDKTHIEDSLKSLEGEFGDLFIRAHRNALVAISQVERLDRLSTGVMALKMKSIPERIEVSRRNLPEVRERLMDLGVS